MCNPVQIYSTNTIRHGKDGTAGLGIQSGRWKGENRWAEEKRHSRTMLLRGNTMWDWEKKKTLQHRHIKQRCQKNKNIETSMLTSMTTIMKKGEGKTGGDPTNADHAHRTVGWRGDGVGGGEG